MKKIFLVCILFFSFINVYAKDYYGEYSTFSEWTDNAISSDDVTFVEQSERFKYYHIDEIGNYFLENENPDDYPLLDEKRFFYGEFSDYSEDIPDNKKNRVIDDIDIYEYQEIKKINKIYIGSTFGTNGSLRITEIVILDKDNNEINYTYECEGCNSRFNEYIHNGIVNENKSNISLNGSLRIYLDKDYNYDEITVKLYLYDPSDEYKSYYITYCSSDGYDYLLTYNFYDNFVSNSVNEVKEVIHNYSNMNQNIVWSKIKTSYNPINSDEYTKVNKKTLYRYKDKYLYYYRIHKSYSDYLAEPTICYDNKSEYFKLFYRYKKRDKVSISDEIIINNKDYNLNDYIKSSLPYDIISNIDINNNGTYKVKFITPIIEVTKDVIVEIDSNTLIKSLDKLNNDYNTLLNKYNDLYNRSLEDESIIENLNKVKDEYNNLLANYDKELNENIAKSNIELYNAMIAEINNYKIKINELNMELDNYKLQLGDKEKEKNKIIKEYDNQILNLKMTNEDNTNECVNEIRTFPLLNIGSYYIWLPLIFIILILLLLFITNRKKKH